MDVDFDLMLQNLNATATDDRKFGLNKFLEAMKTVYQFDIDETNSSSIRILFSNSIKVSELFAAIGRLLRDPDWRIRKDTFEILISIITKDILKDRLDFYISGIMKHLIKCLSDSIMTVRKSATQCLHEYLNKSSDFEQCMRDFVEYGLSGSIDITQRQDNNQALQVVLTPNFAGHDFTELIAGVVNQLNIVGSDDRKIESIVLSVLRSLRKLVGDERFVGYRINLPASVSSLYAARCASSVESVSSVSIAQNTEQSIATSPFSSATTATPTTATATTNFPSKRLPSLSAQSNEAVHFGFIPRSVMDDIGRDRKLEAIEEIHSRFQAIGEREMRAMLPQLGELLTLVRRLMEDKYLVVVTAFKLLIDVVNSVPTSAANSHLEALMQLLRVVLAQNSGGDAIIQKYTMAYAMALFQKCDTDELLTALCDGQFMMDARQATVRQTSIDIVISALLLFPSTKFDLDFLCGKVAQRLMDRKIKVRCWMVD